MTLFDDKVPLDPAVGAVIVGMDPWFCVTKLFKAASYLQKPKSLFLTTDVGKGVEVDSTEHHPLSLEYRGLRNTTRGGGEKRSIPPTAQAVSGTMAYGVAVCSS